MFSPTRFIYNPLSYIHSFTPPATVYFLVLLQQLMIKQSWVYSSNTYTFYLIQKISESPSSCVKQYKTLLINLNNLYMKINQLKIVTESSKNSLISVFFSSVPQSPGMNTSVTGVYKLSHMQPLSTVHIYYLSTPI